MPYRRLPSQRSSRFAPLVLPLESRRLFCGLPHDAAATIERLDYDGPALSAAETGGAADIVWTNRGSSSSDTDRFNSVFGANAARARGVIDAVIAHFERMIGSFNYVDGSTTFNLTLSMASSGSSLGASASLTQTLGNVPKAGSISMGRGSNGAGAGWFLDPTPNDNSEYLGSIVNAFSGDAPVGSPARNLSDFYTVAAAEITHTLGLFGGTGVVDNWDNFTTNTGIPDTAEGQGLSNFWVFRGPSISHLLTGYNAGSPNSFNGGVHSAGPTPLGVEFEGSVYYGGQDIGNARYETSRRYIPNLAFALMFRDAYGYSSVNPAEFGSFYAALNEATRTLTLRGIAGSNDTIGLSVENGQLVASVDIANDAPGTGALPGVGDLPAWVSRFDLAAIDSVVITGDGGADAITIDLPAALANPLAIQIDGGAGTDTITVRSAPANATVRVAPSADADVLRLADTASSAAATLTAGGLFSSIEIGNNGRLFAPATGTVRTAALAIAPSGQLDLLNGAFVVDYATAGPSPVAQVGAWLAAGRNDGTWDGLGGIASGTAAGSALSDAIGLAEANDLFTLFPAVFEGASVDASSLLLRYTLAGDADLNRTVDLADFSTLASNFNATEAIRWSRGDFTYDNGVDIADFALLAQNFNTTLPGDLPRVSPGAPGALPSPTRDDETSPADRLIHELF